VNRQNRQVLCRIFYIKIKNPKVSPMTVSFGFLSFGGDGGSPGELPRSPARRA
jgi:hypothetical protein